MVRENRETHRQLNVLHGHERGVSYVVFDRQNPSTLISGSDDCTVKVGEEERMNVRFGTYAHGSV